MCFLYSAVSVPDYLSERSTSHAAIIALSVRVIPLLSDTRLKRHVAPGLTDPGAGFTKRSCRTKELIRMFDKDYVTWNNCRKHEQRCGQMYATTIS